jgi:SAM-dependent methyltransferase
MTPLARQNYWLISKQLGVTSNERLAAALIGTLRIDQNSFIVDIGCGTAGDAAIIFRRTGAHIVGVDTSAAMLSRVQPPIEAIQADACAMPLQGSFADAAYSVNLMQLLPDRCAMFREVARILRSGGLFALLMTSRHQLRGRFLNQFFPQLLDIEQKRYPAIASLFHELKASGFVSARCYRVDLGAFTVDERYLNRQRSGIVSGLSLLPYAVREEGLRRLAQFIASWRSEGRICHVRWIRTLVIAKRGRGK